MKTGTKLMIVGISTSISSIAILPQMAIIFRQFAVVLCIATILLVFTGLFVGLYGAYQLDHSET